MQPGSVLTVTLNPAWDVTYRVDELAVGQTHRVTEVHGQAGGKGVNVGRVLHALGHPVLLTGAVGGATGALLLADLAAAGLPSRFATVDAATRTSVAVTDDGGSATVFNETGVPATADPWPAVRDHVTALMPGHAVVVLAGSLPPWAPPDAYARLVTASHDAGARSIVDADGPALAAALAAGPDLVKPNRDELARATGHGDLEAGIAAVLRAGARSVVVSDGEHGLHADDGTGRWHALPPRIRPVNPTGAGDAAVAALAVGLAAADDWATRLRRAAAWSAATVLHPLAGRLDPAVADALAGDSRVELVRPGTPAVSPC